MLKSHAGMWSPTDKIFHFILTPWSTDLPEKLTGSQTVKKFPAFYGIWGSLPHSQVLSPGPRLSLWMVNTIRFYREELLALRPTPKPEHHPLSAVRDCLFNIFAATLHTGGGSSIRNLRTRQAVVTGTPTYHGSLYTYLLTYSMVQSSSWEANWFAASQEIPRIFMEPEGSLPQSQASATCPCPGPAQSSPHTHIPPPGDPS